MKDLISGGAVGEVSLIRTSFSFNFSRDNYNIRLDAAKGGGAMWDVGCYGVHSALHLMNEKVMRVTGAANIDPDYKVDTTSSATLTLNNGTLIQVDCSFDLASRNTYEVVGAKGIITVHDAYRPDKKNHQGIITLENEKGIQEYVESGDQYSLQIRTFMEAVKNNSSLEQFHKETLRYIEAMEAIQKEILI